MTDLCSLEGEIKHKSEGMPHLFVNDSSREVPFVDLVPALLFCDHVALRCHLSPAQLLRLARLLSVGSIAHSGLKVCLRGAFSPAERQHRGLEAAVNHPETTRGRALAS